MILVNGQFLARENVHIDLEDRGYQFGDGIYEVAKVYNGKLFRLDEHLTRLARSARELRITLPMPLDELKEQLLKLVEVNKLLDGIIYLQVTRGVAPRLHSFPGENVSALLTAYTKDLPRPLAEITNGVKVVTTEDIRWLRCDIKSINLLGNVLAKQHAVENNAKEAIQIRGNIVTEGSSSNFLIVKGGAIITHPATNLILKGITRDCLEELAAKLSIPFIEREFTLAEAYEADEAMITSTTSEVTPVVQINDQKIANGIGPITKLLQEEFLKLTV